MKLRNLLLIGIAVLFAFSSCKKDDDNAISIVGTWKYDTMEFDIATGDPAMDAFFNVMLQTMSSMLDMTVTFRENGTYTATSSMMGQTETENGNWRLENGRLFLDGEEVPHSLSRNRLSIHAPMGFLEEDELEMFTKFEMSVHFDRQ